LEKEQICLFLHKRQEIEKRQRQHSLFVELGSACSEFVFACLFGEVVGLDEALL